VLNIAMQLEQNEIKYNPSPQRSNGCVSNLSAGQVDGMQDKGRQRCSLVVGR
jgi:hypothetical protein